MRSFDIAGRRIGEGAPVFFIAEMSANHGQRKDVALATIEAAAKAGADAIKLQTYTPDTLTLNSAAPHFVVKTKNVWSGRTLYDLYREAMTPWEWHAELKACAESLGLLLFSTPFDPTAVAFLESLDMPAHKIASFELNDLPLVERVARTGKPMILSTGMATLGDIEAALAVCRGAGNEKLALLRCVSSYPAKPESMGLASYEVLKAFGTVVGLSDHTRDATVAVASVALGAKLIEKHFILDRNMGGPDAFFSLEPDEFRAMVTAVRDTEKALGTPRFGPSPDELPSLVFRRSLFVARDVDAGAVLTCDDVRSVRPSAGIQPRHMPQILGRTATRALAAATPLGWDMVGPEPHTPVKVRSATAEDIARVLSWRKGASDVRAADAQLLVAEVDGTPVGAVHLDAMGNGEWSVSITVGPEGRPAEYAGDMLRSAELVARSLGACYLVAVIEKGNEASVTAFKRAGYYGFAGHPKDPGLLVCERRILDYIV